MSCEVRVGVEQRQNMVPELCCRSGNTDISTDINSLLVILLRPPWIILLQIH